MSIDIPGACHTQSPLRCTRCYNRCMYRPVTWKELHAMTIELCRSIRVDAIWQSNKTKPEIIVAVARGGLSIASMAADYLKLPVTTITISTYTHLTKTTKAQVSMEPSGAIANKSVLLIDDIADTGDTLNTAKHYLLRNNARLCYSTAIFYKKNSRHKPDWYQETTDKWVVFPFELAETIRMYNQKPSKDLLYALNTVTDGIILTSEYPSI